MTMHWAKTLGSKQVTHFKPHINRTLNETVGFPFNATEYENSHQKVLWDQIFIEALNHSSSNRNTTYLKNAFMKKTILIGDMGANSKVHPHSFTMVMVIASMFLFFTLAITVAVIIFCRKKNIVFAFQKSEQEDGGEYELDDMDTNTDFEYGSDDDAADENNPNCITPSSKHKQYGQYLQVDNPTYKVNNNCSSALEEQMVHSPIYRPKRSLSQSSDNRGAYQPINVSAEIKVCNEDLHIDNLITTNGTLNDSPIFQQHCNGKNRKRHFLHTELSKQNTTSENSTNAIYSYKAVDGDLRESCKCGNGKVTVISISSSDQRLLDSDELSSDCIHHNENSIKNHSDKYPSNFQNFDMSNMNTEEEMVVQIPRAIITTSDTHVKQTLKPHDNKNNFPSTNLNKYDQKYEKYDTEIRLLSNKKATTAGSTTNNVSHQYSENAVVRLTGLMKDSPGGGTEPLISSFCHKPVLNVSASVSFKTSEDVEVEGGGSKSYKPCKTNGNNVVVHCNEAITPGGNINHKAASKQGSCGGGPHSLQTSPLKTLVKNYPHNGVCQSLPTTPHGNFVTPQGNFTCKNKWVTFDDML